MQLNTNMNKYTHLFEHTPRSATYTAATLHGAASDMCQSDLFTLVNCLKALPLAAAAAAPVMATRNYD